MLSLALSLTLMSSSGGLLAEYTPPHARLLEEATPVPGTQVAQYNPRQPYAQPYAPPQQGYAQPGMSLDQLKAEYARLQDDMPGLGGPIGMLVGGGLLVIFSWIWFPIFVFSVPELGVVLFLVSLAAGATLLIIGGIMLGHNIREQHRIRVEMRQIEGQIRALEGGGQPLPQGPVPPPPPPPQGQGFTNVEPSLALATF